MKAAQATSCIASYMALHYLHERQWHIAFGIYVLSDLNLNDALTYSCMQGPVDREYCKEVLQQRYLVESVEEINSVLEETHDWRGLRSDINKWLAERALYEWVQDINETAAVAPSYETVYNEFTRIAAEYKLCGFDCTDYNSKRQWVRRWMARWKLHRSAVTSHIGLHAQDIVQKVRAKSSKVQSDQNT